MRDDPGSYGGRLAVFGSTLRSGTRLLAMAVAFWCEAACAQLYGLDTRAALDPFLNGQLPASQAGGTGDWAAVVAFPHLTFDDATCLTPEPRSRRLHVCGRQGIIWSFENNPETTTRTVVLDIRDRTQGWESCGLLGMAFHPEFGLASSTNRGFFYVHYSYSPNPRPSPPGWDTTSFVRVSRFTVPDGSRAADPNSELVLVNQYDRHVWHAGGPLFFDAAGFLYFANGDEGGVNDFFDSAQTISGGFFSGMWRIDVDRDPTRSHPIRRQPRSGGEGSPPSYSANYFIPNDNPFQDAAGGVLEEFWVLGLRSPHRASLDPVTGRIWVGDVGQDVWEEINLMEPGRNYQWPFGDGFHEGAKPRPASIIGIEQPPLYEYVHDQNNDCIIGGYVYRGGQFAADLGGKYIFGDNGSGRIWAMTWDGANPPEVEELCRIQPSTTWTGISSFGLDQEGEIYVCKMGHGEPMYRLARGGAPVEPPPALLSQTGAFTDLSTLQPAPGLIPYDLNVPFWSDGAIKRRWVAVPNDGAPFGAGEAVAFSPTGLWGFPAGTVLVKHFELPVDDADPNVLRRLETRFIVRDSGGGVYGLTYKWRADRSDADLLATHLSESIAIQTESGGTRQQTWYYPSRQDCLVCHNSSGGGVLGPNTRQLNRPMTYPATGRTDNQLRTWNHLGLFEPPLNESAIAGYDRLSPIDDAAVPLETRVRSYLDANCAYCHRPDGVYAHFDARYTTPLPNQHIIGGALAGAGPGPGARVVVPGDPSLSVMYLRMNSTDPLLQMPPLARNQVDAEAVQRLEEWILSLPAGDLLPSPWNNRDIGGVAVAGSATFADGTFTVSAAGTDIWEGSDQFHFVHQPWSGEGEIVARVTALGNTDPWAKAGVMFRADLTPGAANAMMLISAAQGAGFQRRLVPGGVSLWTAGDPLAGVPYWVRLTREAETINAYGSTDGRNWTFVGVELISMTDPIQVGLAVTARNPALLNTAGFTEVRLVQAGGPHLRVEPEDAGGRMRLFIEGRPGTTYVVVVSQDLRNWTDLASITQQAAVAEYVDENAPAQAQRFYRVRRE